jgi:hypothetical protein
MRYETWLRACDRLNLLPDWPGDTWDGTRASFAAMMLAYELPAYDAVVICGRRVGEAFGLGTVPWFRSYREVSGRGPLMIPFPHPSGRNRWWNTRSRKRAPRFLMRLLRAA